MVICRRYILTLRKLLLRTRLLAVRLSQQPNAASRLNSHQRPAPTCWRLRRYPWSLSRPCQEAGGRPGQFSQRRLNPLLVFKGVFWRCFYTSVDNKTPCIVNNAQFRDNYCKFQLVWFGEDIFSLLSLFIYILFVVIYYKLCQGTSKPALHCLLRKKN